MTNPSDKKLYPSESKLLQPPSLSTIKEPDPAQPLKKASTEQTSVRWLSTSFGKLLQIAGVFLVSTVGAWSVSSVIDDRSYRQEEMRQEIYQSWGPSQLIKPPTIAVPFQYYAEGYTQYLQISPQDLEIKTIVRPESKRRNLFHANVYVAEVEMSGTFQLPPERSINELTKMSSHSYDIAKDKPGNIHWDEALVYIQLTGLQGFNTTKPMEWNGQKSFWSPCLELSLIAKDCVGTSVVTPVKLAAPMSTAGTPYKFSTKFQIRGSETLTFALEGQRNKMEMRSIWPNPSFNGDVLPEISNVDDGGFTAIWTTNSRRTSPIWTNGKIETMTTDRSIVLTKAGVTLLDEMPIYQVIERVSKYQSLFLALAFTCYFLFELLSGIRIHIVPYGLLGLSLILFPLLLVSIGEIIGFDWGYLISSSMVLGQAIGYTKTVAQSGLLPLVFGLLMLTLFGFLYVVIGLDVYALLLGTLALFLALSVVMMVTRKVNWYGSPVPQAA